MTKKNTGMLIAVALGVGALYLLYKSENGIGLFDPALGGDASSGGQQSAPGSDTNGAGGMPQVYNVQYRTPSGQTQSVPISSPKEGVDFINQNWGSLLPTGKTLEVQPKGSSVSVKGVSGVFTSGTVSQLAGVKDPVYIGVREPERDSAGLSAFDRTIIKNYEAKLGMSITPSYARERGFI